MGAVSFVPFVSTCLAGLAEFERYAVKSGPAAARARGVVLGVAQWSSDKNAKRVLFTHHRPSGAKRVKSDIRFYVAPVFLPPRFCVR
jgi:hypothetical protein